MPSLKVKPKVKVVAKKKKVIKKAVNLSSKKKAVTAAKPVRRFPEAELRTWLQGRSFWNGDDWGNLLASLHSLGYAELVNSNEGRDAIGAFLEANRQRF